MSTPSWLKEKDPGQKNIFDLDSGRRERDLGAAKREPQVSLFEQSPPPPTGPLADPYSREEGKPHAFIKFMESEDGPKFWQALQDAALDALRRQEKRFSTRTFLARYRDDEKVRINDHFSPWLADQLVAEHPQLIDIIERRVRKKEGPFLSKESLSDKLLDIGVEDALVMDGYDDCVMGVLERFGMEPIILYDKEKVIEKIMNESPDSSYQEALEYYEFNQLGGWHGDRTPGFLVKIHDM